MFQKIELRPIDDPKHDLLIEGRRLAIIGLATIALSLGIPQCSTKIAEVTSAPSIVTPTLEVQTIVSQEPKVTDTPVQSVTTTAAATTKFEELTSTATMTDVPKTVTPILTSTETHTPMEILISTLTSSPTATEVLPTPTETVIPLDIFVEKCKKNGVGAACIHSEGVLALRLRMGNEKDIPFENEVAQLWNGAWIKGEVVGILAHDNFEGQKFFKLNIGGVVSLIWSNGTIERYLISEKTMWRYEDNKEFFSPWDGGDKISSLDLARHYFIGGDNFNKMVLQTCIDTNAGVLFVVAYRVK